MPDVAVHAAFGREVLASLPEEVREYLIPEPYTFALFGPDVWFMYKPWHRREGRGRRMHTGKPGLFLTTLLRRAQVSASPVELLSYLSGFLCHYALDSIAHPYIIYVTAEEHVFPRSHMSLEHALDVVQFRRDGYENEKHPVTEHYYPRLHLPETLRPDLDAVFEEVYGWKNCWSALNRSCRRYRLCYRALENPQGLAARIARRTKRDVLCSLAYSESQFHSLDPENTEHRPWKHPFDHELSFTESFPELREKARQFTLQLIEASYRLVRYGEGSVESISELIGNNSYLSGLPADDPRNYRVKSLLPPEKETR